MYLTFTIESPKLHPSEPFLWNWLIFTKQHDNHEDFAKVFCDKLLHFTLSDSCTSCNLDIAQGHVVIFANIPVNC